jgi:hypothetical protein
MATLSINARLCYRLRWLGGIIWEISVEIIGYLQKREGLYFEVRAVR